MGVWVSFRWLVEYSRSWGWDSASNGLLMTKAGLPMNRFMVVAGKRVVGVALRPKLGALGLEPAFRGGLSWLWALAGGRIATNAELAHRI
jgi:hypothetical protein